MRVCSYQHRLDAFLFLVEQSVVTLRDASPLAKEVRYRAPRTTGRGHP